MKLFADRDLRDFLEQNTQRLQAHVESEDEQRLQATAEEEYVQELLDEFEVERLVIRFDDMHASSREVEIEAERFPFDFDVRPGKRYKKPVVRFHLPFDGNEQLLRCIPSTRIRWTIEVTLETGELVFEVINWRNDPKEIQRAYEEVLRSIRTQYGHLASEVDQYNKEINKISRQILNDRRQTLQNRSDVLAALGVPLKLASASASTESDLQSDRGSARVSNTKRTSKATPHVFVSYVRDDQTQVKRLVAALQSRGVNVWLDRRQILPGQRWKDAIRRAIREGSFFLACFSAAYSQRRRTYMNEELTLAIEELRQRPTDRAWFIPVVLRGGSVPDRSTGAGESLHDLQWAELTDENWDSELDRIGSVILSEAVS